MSFSRCGSLFGITGDYGNFVVVYDTKTKERLAKVRCKNSFVNMFKFSNDGVELFVGTTNSSLRRYSIETGKLIRELPAVHRDGFTSFDLTKNSKFIITGGKDQLIKVWDY